MTYSNRLDALCAAAESETLDHSSHYSGRRIRRPTPSEEAVRSLLCDDAPEIIEDYPDDPRGSSCLIWGIIDDGRVAHIVCRNPPTSKVITAYFPGETHPEKWGNNYRIRL